MGKMTDDEKRQICNGLETVIMNFNQNFQDWMERTGCRATFGWRYGGDKEVKTLEIVSVDAMIYRKPAPAFAQPHIMADILGEKKPSQCPTVPSDPRVPAPGVTITAADVTTIPAAAPVTDTLEGLCVTGPVKTTKVKKSAVPTDGGGLI